MNEPVMQSGIDVPAPEGGETNRLPIAEASRPDELLVGPEGEAVWPAHSDAGRDILESSATLFGSTLSSVPAHQGEAAPGEGLVVGVGATEGNARLYAHLTARAWKMVDSWEEALEAPPEVLLLSSTRLDSRLLERLMALPRGQAPVGLIWGRTDEELNRQVLIRSAAVRLNGPVSKHRIDISAGLSLEKQATPGFDLLGGKASTKDVREAMACGAGVLTLQAHSWGWNVLVSAPHTVICGIDRPQENAKPGFGPSCLETGFCDAVERPVEDALAEGRLVWPETLAARVLVLASCRNVLVESNSIDSTWSLLPRMLLNPRIGALLATPELMLTTYQSVSDHLSKQLAAGHAVGPSLAKYERSPLEVRAANRLLLFGDPRVRAVNEPPPASKPEVRMPTISFGQQAPAEGNGLPAVSIEVDSDLELLREIALHIFKEAVEAASESSVVALDAIRRFERAEEDELPVAESELRDAMLAHIRTMRGRPSEAWMGQSEMKRDTEAELATCPSCQWESPPYVVETRAGVPRRFLNCPRCMVGVDQPLSSNLEIAVRGHEIELGGDIPTDDWSAGVVLVPTRFRDAHLLPWPKAPSGEPQRLFELRQDEWPPGPLELRVVFIRGFSLDTVGAAIRAPHPKKPAAMVAI